MFYFTIFVVISEFWDVLFASKFIYFFSVKFDKTKVRSRGVL